MSLDDLIDDLLTIRAEIGNKQLHLKEDMYLCLVDGDMVLENQPIGSVIYILTTQSELH